MCYYKSILFLLKVTFYAFCFHIYTKLTVTKYLSIHGNTDDFIIILSYLTSAFLIKMRINMHLFLIVYVFQSNRYIIKTMTLSIPHA